MTTTPQIFGIIGYPLGHSLSPTLHNWGFARTSFPGTYCRWPVTAEQLPAFMLAVRTLNIRGVSVTIPHKESVIPHLNGLTPRALAVGAVNTLYWEGDLLMGDNTDVAGFLAPLQLRHASITSALVLGAGGAARAVLAGLREVGCQKIVLANRSPEAARKMAAEFGATPCPWEERKEVRAELLVNTTPLGMLGDFVDQTPWEGSMGRFTLVYDLIYNPLQTRLLGEAEDAGCTTLSGLDMFIHQGLAQFQRWTGLEFPLAEADRLLRKHLG
jgi:shikimate dehydrogenase